MRRNFSVVYLCFVFLWLGNMPGFAQSVVTLTDTVDNLWIGRQIYYLEDKENHLNFGQLQSGSFDGQFIRCEQDAPNFGNIQTTIWNKFTVENQSSKEWLISVHNYNIDTLTYYYQDTGGRYREIVSGSSRPLSSRKYKTPYYTFDLPVPRGETRTFYLKVQTYIFQYPILVSSREKFIAELHTNNILKGLYYGFALLMVIYNLILFLTLRERAYLYYVLYIIFLSLLMAEHAGFNALLLGDNFHFLWQQGPLVLAIAGLLFLAFSQAFLETKKYAPRAHRLSNYLFLPLYATGILFHFLNKDLYTSVINQVAGAGLLLFMTVTAFFIYRQGYWYARFYIYATSAYFAGVLVFVLKTFAVIPYNLVTTNSMEIGSALEMMLFSFSMAARINSFKQEKAKAQKELLESLTQNEKLVREQNKILEERVEERTGELRKTLTALEKSQQELEQKNAVITREKDRSESLLLNILPYETAQELKEKGSSTGKYFGNVTVMFTDFKNFTGISETLEPAELVAELDYCFKGFDRIIDKYDVEKIKTIGDSYMAASGLPVPDEEHAVKMVEAGLDILEFMKAYNVERVKKGVKPFEIRIGIHTGSVVAGIVGIKKFAYDIWGDTVNTASRIESSGEAGRINISKITYDLIRERFECTHRGRIQAKNKGDIDMYFVEGRL